MMVWFALTVMLGGIKQLSHSSHPGTEVPAGMLMIGVDGSLLVWVFSAGTFFCSRNLFLDETTTVNLLFIMNWVWIWRRAIYVFGVYLISFGYLETSA